MMRKMLSIVVAVIISVTSLLSGNILAAYIPPDSPQYDYTCSCVSELKVSGTTATCRSEAVGYINKTTQIVITQTLQKQNSSGIWTDVSGATWTSTINNYVGSATNTKSGLSSGTYRLKSAFKVYVGNSYEPIVKYSQSKTI